METVIISKDEKRKLVEKAFLLGVDWLLKVMQEHPEFWNVDANDAKILRKRAQKVIENYSVPA